MIKNKLQVFLRHTIKGTFFFVLTIIRSIVSSSMRHKMASVYQDLRFPFHGKKHISLSHLLIDEDLHVCVGPLKAEEHNTSEFELTALCALLKQNRTQTGFEIGTFNGRTARALAINLTLPDSVLYTLNIREDASETVLETSQVDIGLARKVTIGEKFHNTPQEQIIKQLWGDSASFDFSPYYNKIDFVFIDGAHSETYVNNDTQIATKLLKEEGGLIVWHDAYLFGVVEFLKKWINENNHPVYFIKNTTLAVTAVLNGKVIDPISFLNNYKKSN